MRSGSNLLEQSLNQFSDITCYGEIFNPSFAPKYPYIFSLENREKDPLDIIQRMISATPEVSGFRIFEGHDARVINAALQDPNCAKIILQRDPLESFISLKIAQKTDQWLLHDASHRKKVKVIFNAEEYQKYHAKLTKYYAHIHKTLQISGQTAFWIRYPEQKDVNTLNGLASFLGVKARIKKIKEVIRRQNPEPLEDKVENFEQLHSFLGTNAGNASTEIPYSPQMRANIPRMVTCVNYPILFAPIPGGPNEEILRWMHTLDGGGSIKGAFSDATNDKSILHTGHSQRTLFEWMQSNPEITSFTAVRHPIVRTYDVFMSKIFATGEGTYDMIRKKLVTDFSLKLPDKSPEKHVDRQHIVATGYGPKEHRVAFHQFLKFLNINLAGQTSIRVDGLWALQTTFISGFNTAVPIAMVAKEGALDPAFRYIESLFDIPTPNLLCPIQNTYMFSLDEIYTRQTENLTRKTYNQDYIRLGFADYQAALDV